MLLPDYSAYNNRLRPGWILMENPRGCVIKGRPTHSEILSYLVNVSSLMLIFVLYFLPPC